MSKIKGYLRFIVVIVIAHTAAYLIAGGIAYQLLTRVFWEGQQPLLSSYLRTPGSPELWNFAMTWQIPVQILRSLLAALVLLPLYPTLKAWGGWKRFFFLSALVFVMTHLAAAVPSPANLEGLVYMKPEFVRLGFFKMQPEMVLYSLLFGAISARFLYRKER